jgi:hypothetical protein
MKDTLAMDIKKLAKQMDLSVDITTRKIALALFDGITQKTPVDTGRAKGNWNMNTAKPSQSVNLKAKTVQNPSLNKGDGLKDIWIVNNLDYIGVLENGYRQRAPVGMVALSVAEIKGQFS